MKGSEGRRGHGGESKHVYKMHEKLLSIEDDYWIENKRKAGILCGWKGIALA